MLTKSVTNVSPPASKDVLPPGLGLRGPRVLPAGNAPAASSTGSRQSTPSPGSRRNDGGQIGIPIGQSQETKSSARPRNAQNAEKAASRSAQPGAAPTGTAGLPKFPNASLGKRTTASASLMQVGVPCLLFLRPPKIHLHRRLLHQLPLPPSQTSSLCNLCLSIPYTSARGFRKARARASQRPACCRHRTSTT